MKRTLIVLSLFVGLLVALAPSDATADKYNVFRSSNVSISSGTSFTITRIVVSSGTGSIVLIDTNSYAANSAVAYPAINVYPMNQRIIPEITLASMTVYSTPLAYTDIPLPPGGIDVQNGLFLYMSNYGAEVGIYTTERAGGRGRR